MEHTLTHLAVTDNADLIFQQRALDLILPKLAKVIKNLQEFALKYKDMPTLGFTHYQPVSATSIDKSQLLVLTSSAGPANHCRYGLRFVNYYSLTDPDMLSNTQASVLRSGSRSS
jgi:hypothetical protein